MKSERLNKNSPKLDRQILKKSQSFTQHTIQSETKEEFLDRQKEYDKLYKYTQIHKEVPKNLKRQNYSNVINQIKEEFYQKKLLKNYFFYEDHLMKQQQKSIQMIAELLRNQRKAVADKQFVPQSQNQQYNLMLILAILFPLICLLTVLTEI